MPVLTRRAADETPFNPPIHNEVEKDAALVGRCSNPGCRSGWLHLFRQRKSPVFEGGWTCSRECTEARVQLYVRRELNGWVEAEQTHRHKIPLGLLMLEKGWISSLQLRRAVEAQKASGTLRIGEWLVAQGAADETMITRALSMQWGCPALRPGRSGFSASERILPRLFVQAFGALPLTGRAGDIQYLGFEQNVDQALAFSVARMEGVRVECGIVPSSTFRDAVQSLQAQSFPALQLAEATSAFAAAHVFSKSIERARPIWSHLVRVHDWLWLRMILKEQNAAGSADAGKRDVLCRVGPLRDSSDRTKCR